MILISFTSSEHRLRVCLTQPFIFYLRVAVRVRLRDIVQFVDVIQWILLRANFILFFAFFILGGKPHRKYVSWAQVSTRLVSCPVSSKNHLSWFSLVYIVPDFVPMALYYRFSYIFMYIQYEDAFLKELCGLLLAFFFVCDIGKMEFLKK